jgi:hypothetical protein
MAWILMDVKFALITLLLTVLIHLHLVNIWEKEDPVVMTVTVLIDTDVKNVLALLLVVEDIIVQEVAADLGLVNKKKNLVFAFY